MEISFVPMPDVVVILNALLDKFENRARHKRTEIEAEGTFNAPRPVRVVLDDLGLPAYFSQIDPQARIVANQQLQTLEGQGLLQLQWLPGETGHLLHSISLKTEFIIPERSAVDSPGSTEHAPHLPQHGSLYQLLRREPLSDSRSRLESLLLAEKFRYPKGDWRAHALNYSLGQLRAGKSPSPFSLTDSNLNLDLLFILAALPTTETPYRVFSVRIFNDSKRFEEIKPALVRLARRANPEWDSFTSEDLLRELNLVANPGFVHLAGNWDLIDLSGQIINLDFFIPSVGFSASQITHLEKVAIRAEAVLCIENLTSFHAFTRKDALHSPNLHPEGHLHPLAPPTGARTGVAQAQVSQRNAVICLMGNPSPAIRHLLRLIPGETPIYLWSDMDYGGFHILSQLRRQVSLRVQPYLMDIATFDRYAHLSRPLTQVDIHNLKRLTRNPALNDVHPIIEHILQRGLKLEQEAIEI